MSNLGSNIKKYRELKGLTQKQLAEAVGKTKNVISNWENGLNKPDADTIEVLLYILEVDANTLLSWDNPEQIKNDAADLANKILTNEKIAKMLPKLENMDEDDLALVINLIDKLSKEG